MDTLPVEGGTRRGTSQGSKRRWPVVKVRINDSVPPTVNDERPPLKGTAARTYLPISDPASRLSTDVQVNTSGADDGHLHIEQDQPFRTEILAVFGVLDASEV
jgi:hypothetical protein